MDSLPPPPYPASTSRRHISKMPLDVERILRSDLVRRAPPAAMRAAFLLWVESWREIPAGSIPGDEESLAALSRAGADWPTVRDDAMRGWQRHADGRHYHPVMVEAVRASLAWEAAQDVRRTAHAAKMRRWRASKALKRPGLTGARPTLVCVDDFASWRDPARDRHATGHVTGHERDRRRDRHVTSLEEESESNHSIESEPRARDSKTARRNGDADAVEARIQTDLVAALMRRGLGPTRAVEVARAARDGHHPEHAEAVRLCENSGIDARAENRPVQEHGRGATDRTSPGKESLP